MPKFKHHIFICQNTREASAARPSCNPAGNSDLVQTFKATLKKYGLSSIVRANKCGCLDQCEHGPTVVIYPEGWWYGNVKPEDVEDIVKAMTDGKTFDRLLLNEDCIHTTSCDHKKP
jgi:(2Fe-2S) ferredoxin